MKVMKKIWIISLVAIAALSACSSDASTPTADKEKTSTEVTIEHIAFAPSELTVDVGSEVIWTNLDDQVTHTVTSGKAGDKGIPGVNEGRPNRPDGLFDGELGGADATFSFSFDEPGTYDYFCEVHPVMTGTIVVQ